MLEQKYMILIYVYMCTLIIIILFHIEFFSILLPGFLFWVLKTLKISYLHRISTC